MHRHSVSVSYSLFVSFILFATYMLFQMNAREKYLKKSEQPHHPGARKRIDDLFFRSHKQAL